MVKKLLKVRQHSMFISVDALRMMKANGWAGRKYRVVLPRWKYSYRVRRAIARPSDRKWLNEAWNRGLEIQRERERQAARRNERRWERGNYGI